MCGCNGDYKLPTHTSIEDANKEIGYEGYDEDSVSDRSVKIAVRKVNAALAEYSDKLVNGEYEGEYGLRVGRNEEHAYVDDGNRNTVVYF